MSDQGTTPLAPERVAAPGSLRARWKRLAPLAIALFVHLYAFPYFGALRHANELPRVLTTQEIVAHGSLRLDDRLAELGSRADISTTPDGRHYQNKAPGLTMLGAVVYWPFAAVARLTTGALPSLLFSTWLLRAVVVTLPAVLFLGLFRRMAAAFADGSAVGRDAATLAYAFGSLAFPYALVFMSHVPAAVVTGTAFVVASRWTRGEVRRPTRSGLLVGLLLGAAMFIEYQALFAAVVIGLFVVLRTVGPVAARLRAAALLAVGAAPSLVALGLVHASCFGSPLRTGYAYSVDPANRMGFWGIVGPSTRAAAQLFTVGSNGLLILSPWVIFSVVGAVVIARDARLRARVGAEALTAAVIGAVYLLFVASLVPEFGRAGWSVGPRYVAVAMPFLAWLAAAGFARCAAHIELLVPALAMVLVSILVNVVAATTYPHWPTQFNNPLYEVSLRLLREGYAPRSLGTALGLVGGLSLAPLYLVAFAVPLVVLRRAGVRALHVGVAAALGFVALTRIANVAPTPEPLRHETWDYLVSTYEPRPATAAPKARPAD